VSEKKPTHPRYEDDILPFIYVARKPQKIWNIRKKYGTVQPTC
jgi:hypothetical protein